MHGGHHHPWRRLRALLEWTLHWRDLPDGVLGVTDHSRRTITLTTGLTQAERRSTIAHELEHAERGPVPAHLQPREERIVDDRAARRLIRFEALVDAMLWAGNDDHQLADELWVDVGMVRARLLGLTAREKLDLERRLDEAEGWMAG